MKPYPRNRPARSAEHGSRPSGVVRSLVSPPAEPRTTCGSGRVIAFGRPAAGAPAGSQPAPSPAGLDATLRSAARVLEPRQAVVLPADPAGGGPVALRSAGWMSCARLLTPQGLEQVLAEIRQQHGASNEVAVSYLAAWYAGNIVGPAIAAFVIAGRVPDLTRERMSVHRTDDGWFDATAFHTSRMTVLPTDPLLAAVAADAGPARADLLAAGVVDVAEDVPALRARLVAEIVGHLEPVISALRGRARLGLPALWGAVSAQCARTFLLTERVTGDPHRGRQEADAFFALACPPLRARPTWHEFVHRGRHHTGMRRGACCLAHRLTAEFCTTCPFTPDEERERRLRELIDTQGYDVIAV